MVMEGLVVVVYLRPDSVEHELTHNQHINETINNTNENQNEGHRDYSICSKNT